MGYTTEDVAELETLIHEVIEKALDEKNNRIVPADLFQRLFENKFQPLGKDKEYVAGVGNCWVLDYVNHVSGISLSLGFKHSHLVSVMYKRPEKRTFIHHGHGKYGKWIELL